MVSVNVMDGFPGLKDASEGFLHDQAVLCDIAEVIRVWVILRVNADVSLASEMTPPAPPSCAFTTVASVVARARAVTPSARLAWSEWLLTVFTGARPDLWSTPLLQPASGS